MASGMASALGDRSRPSRSPCPVPCPVVSPPSATPPGMASVPNGRRWLRGNRSVGAPQHHVKAPIEYRQPFSHLKLTEPPRTLQIHQVIRGGSSCGSMNPNFDLPQMTARDRTTSQCVRRTDARVRVGRRRCGVDPASTCDRRRGDRASLHRAASETTIAT
jgi:hypothetical protein